MSPCRATDERDRTVAAIDAELRGLEMASRAVRRALATGDARTGNGEALQHAHVLWRRRQQLRRERAAVIARGTVGLRQLRDALSATSPVAP